RPARSSSATARGTPSLASAATRDVRPAVFPRLSPPPPPPPPAEVRRAELAAELAALRERTRAEAFAAGRDEGLAEGRARAYGEHGPRLIAAARAFAAAAEDLRRRAEAASAA